ncbi:hypothetical protein [Bradyrhizobium sp. SEMIA]|uniref:hypothetical protein n=1 Tax=Bradyrhizobium sp. SEMIA TaxID=2597515 RepID=UPI0018A368D7|nr:hypothetical protein [Bradyrhizobium sp. SEMIA]QOG23167.1 hypothetical protein FOM02_43885 [Bradyrhizobium sp. SEMIA]
MRRTARAIVASLQAQPRALALVILNVLFLASFMLMLREISASSQRRDQVMIRLVERCAAKEEGRSNSSYSQQRAFDIPPRDGGGMFKGED